MKMSMQYWWNGTDRGKQQCWEETLPDCHFKDENRPELYLKIELVCTSQ